MADLSWNSRIQSSLGSEILSEKKGCCRPSGHSLHCTEAAGVCEYYEGVQQTPWEDI